jgi:hypothetical protein
VAAASAGAATAADATVPRTAGVGAGATDGALRTR